MSKKIIIAILSILSIFFLTAQTCSFGTTSGLALECDGEGDIVCSDDDEAYVCGITATGFYTSRSTEDDAAYCGATEEVEVTDTDGDGYSDRLEDIAGSDPEDATSVPSPRDDDADGMYDIWERHYGLDFTTDDSADDPDSDGLTNLEEFLADTDPTEDDTDGDGMSDSDEVAAGSDPTVADTTEASAPTAVCSASTTTAEVMENIYFYGSSSTDSDGTIVSYEWDFDYAGMGTSVADTAFGYADAGTYTVTLTVTDDDGSTDDCTLDVTVSESTGTCVDTDCTYGCNADSTDCATFCEAFSEDELVAIGDLIDFNGGLEGEAIAIAVNDAGDGIDLSLSTLRESDSEVSLPFDATENAILWEIDGIPAFLEGDSCYDDECEDAYFILIDEDGGVHLMQFANINILLNEADIDDITAVVSDTGLSYTDGSATTISLPNAGFDIVLTVDETSQSIAFDDIWLNAEEAITTYYAGTLKLINTDGSSRIFEGFTFSEYDDGVADSYLQDFGMSASYDATDGIEVNSEIGILAEGTDGYWSSTEGDVTYFLTWKGTAVMYNAAEQSVGVVHPEATSTYLSDIEDCD